jgi:hypothetical protein
MEQGRKHVPQDLLLNAQPAARRVCGLYALEFSPADADTTLAALKAAADAWKAAAWDAARAAAAQNHSHRKQAVMWSQVLCVHFDGGARLCKGWLHTQAPCPAECAPSSACRQLLLSGQCKAPAAPHVATATGMVFLVFAATGCNTHMAQSACLQTPVLSPGPQPLQRVGAADGCLCFCHAACCQPLLLAAAGGRVMPHLL